MDGRINYPALERSRLIGSTLEHLPPSFPGSDSSRSSALSRLGVASAAVAAVADASVAVDLARAGPPTALGQYAGRYIPPPGMHSPAASYALMAGYMGGNMPAAVKGAMPEFQQYWRSQEEYTRYILSMYYPCLPYLPATESLSLFTAQNSATAQAAHHRIYDLQKEAILSAGGLPLGFFPPNLLGHCSQLEATNLSVPGSKNKTSGKSRDSESKEKSRHSDSHKADKEDATTVLDVRRYPRNESDGTTQSSERTRGMNRAWYNFDGKDKRKTSHEHASTRHNAHLNDAPTDMRTQTGGNKPGRSLNKLTDDCSTSVHIVTAAHDPVLDLINQALIPKRSAAIHSPARPECVLSPDVQSLKIQSPDRGQTLKSPFTFSNHANPAMQDAPENLCVKDEKRTDTLKHGHIAVPCSVKIQSIVTATTVTVTSTLTVITSDRETGKYVDNCDNNVHRKFPSPRQSSEISPLPNSCSASSSLSLPYYHNLFSRTQPSSQEGKKVHAVTYVPEVGCLSSPVIGIPFVKDADKCDNANESINKRNSKQSTICNMGIDADVKYDWTHKHKHVDTISNRDCNNANSNSKVSVNASKHRKGDRVANNEEITADNDVDDALDIIETECCMRHQTFVQTIETKSKDNACAKQTKHPGTICLCHCEASEVVKLGANDHINRKLESKEKNAVACDNKLKKLNLFIDTDSVSGNADPSKHIVSTYVKREGTIHSTTKTTDCETMETGQNKECTYTNKYIIDQGTLNDQTILEKEIGCQPNEIPTGKNEINDNKTFCGMERIQDKLLKKTEHSNTSDNLLGGKVKPRDSSEPSRPGSTSAITSAANELNDAIVTVTATKHFNNVLSTEKTISTCRVSKERPSMKSSESSQGTGQSIPVGIAVARQRSIAPKGQTGKEAKKTTEDGKHKTHTSAEIEPVRPLKVIQPFKGTPNTPLDMNNALPANLIVTGGASGNGNVFWPDDSACRQIAAAHIMQKGNHPITAPTWYGHDKPLFPPSTGMVTMGGRNLPITVPPGYKLAQDSLTGQILLLPPGPEVIDNSRVLSGFSLGHQLHPHAPFPGSLFAGQTTGSLSTIFAGPLSDSTSGVDIACSHYPQLFAGSVVPQSEVIVKDADTQRNPSGKIAPSSDLIAGDETNRMSLHLVSQDTDRDKLIGGEETIFVTDGQTEKDPDFNPTNNPAKVEPANVQSRGTSPMLPATDSSNDENEEICSRIENELQSETDKCKHISLCAEKEHTISVDDHDAKYVNGKYVARVIENDSIDAESDDKGSIKEEANDTVDNPDNDRDCIYNDCDTSISDLENEVCKTLSSAKLKNVTAIESEIKTGTSTDLFVSVVKRSQYQSNRGRAGSKSDRNIFSELTEYNPFIDPQILQASDGLELLSTLAEKSVLCSKVSQQSHDDHKPSDDTDLLADTGGESFHVREIKDDVTSHQMETESVLTPEYKHKHLKLYIATSAFQHKDANVEKDHPSQVKARVRCGHEFKLKKGTKPVEGSASVRMTTFCGIQIPEAFDMFLRLDDDVIDCMEQEMRLRLAELQGRYREKQRQLAKLKPSRERENDRDKEKDNKSTLKDKAKEMENDVDTKRGPGRPKKRRNDSEIADTPTTSSKHKTTKRDTGNGSNFGHGSSKKKIAEMLVDRVFRKTGSSFKIPLSKNVNLIAPARIELPGGSSSPGKKEPRRHKKSSDFAKLIKRSRLSQLNGKDRSFAGGLWHHRKEDKRKDKKQKHSTSHLSRSTSKRKRTAEEFPEDHGLGLLAEYAIKSEMREEKLRTSSPVDKVKPPSEDKKTNTIKHEAKLKSPPARDKQQTPPADELLKTVVSDERLKLPSARDRLQTQSGRYKPKTQSLINRHISSPDDKLRNYSVEDKRKSPTPEDETNKKNPFKDDKTMGDSSPDSPSKKRKPGRPRKCDIVQPGVTETIVAKQSKHMDFLRLQVDEPEHEIKITLEGKTPLKPIYLDEWNVRRSERIFLSDPSPSPQTSPNPVSTNVCTKGKQEDAVEKKNDKQDKTVKSNCQKKTKLANIQNITQKVMKKYSTNYSQKSREKHTDIFKTYRDKLTQKRQEKKLNALSSSSVATGSSKLVFDKVNVQKISPMPEPPNCVIGKDELVDGMRILIFMDGLFHEAELKAIRPPDIYGAILNNERRTRPHICSQEEILKNAIKDIQPPTACDLPEGTRICAYWSQQFSCLYPGTIPNASPNPGIGKSFVNVEFDDGDAGTIPLEHIRMIPQDFPVVEYDPHPLLLLTKRRRTVSISEVSEPRKSNVDLAYPSKDANGKRGPGRPSKTDRMVSVESMGDVDVFVDKEKAVQATTNENSNAGDDTVPSPKKTKRSVAHQKADRQPWTWAGSSTKRPGMKGKARKEYYKSVVCDREILSIGDSAVFVSTGRSNLPYVGHIDSLYEGWDGQMVVKVKWFYHPEEIKGGRPLQTTKGALFQSDHEDENDVQTISHKCEVVSLDEYNRRKVLSVHDMTDVFYLAGTYQPIVGYIKFESGVV